MNRSGKRGIREEWREEYIIYMKENAMAIMLMHFEKRVTTT